MTAIQGALFERILGLVVIALLIVACLQILSPFVGAILWAAILVVATWPLHAYLQNRLGDRPRLATALMTTGLALVLVGPIAVLTESLTEHVSSASHLVQDLTSVKLPENPPAWLTGIPLAGPRLEQLWRGASADMAGAVERVRPYIRAALGWLLAQGANLGLALLQFLLAIVIAAVLYANGRDAGRWVQRFAVRVGGPQSLGVLELAAHTIRGVSLGIVGTAAIQALLSGFGFWLAGVPAVVLLSFFCFFTAMLQIGTGLVWIPVAIWLAYQDQQGWAIFTVAWGIFVNVIDNFIKPYLISHGSGLPLALIFMGVIGGLLVWGVIGIFLGPTLLATGYMLFKNWLAQGEL
jgi:predicted PurR-regulated permease PerM